MAEHTFLFADLAGFTALTEAHGDDRAADLAEEFFSCVRELLDRSKAVEVKTIGDAVMLRAESAGEAIELGLAIVNAIEARHGFPVVRVGMSTGEAVERKGDWFGSTVNLAARISAAAGGSEVLLDEATRRAAGRLEGIELERRGEAHFKNLAEPVRVFSAAHRDRGGDERAVDPVCRMAIVPGSSAGSLVHDGTRYEFCSLACAARFAQDPARFAHS